jgi:hypothetical protein
MRAVLVIVRTFKREEIDARDYEDLEDLRLNIYAFPRTELLAKSSSRIARDSVHNCRADRAAPAVAFVTFVPNPMGQSKMAAVSRLADFSFDRYVLFAPVSTHLGRRCATQVLTASNRKS